MGIIIFRLVCFIFTVILIFVVKTILEEESENFTTAFITAMSWGILVYVFWSEIVLKVS